MPIIISQPIPEIKERMSFSGLRQSFQTIGLKATKRSFQSANYVSGSAGWTGTFRGDLIGATITGGIIQTASSGQRIVLTDTDDSLTLYDSSENQLFKLFVDASIIAGISTFAGSAATAVNIAVAGTGVGLASEISNAANADSAGYFRTNGLGYSLYVLVASNASRTKPTLYLNATAGQGAHIGLYPIATEPQTPSEGEIYANENGNLYYHDGLSFKSLNRPTTIATSKEAGEDLLEGEAVYLSTGGLTATKEAENTTGTTDATIWGVRWGGQTFLFADEKTITKVNLMLKKVGTPVGNITLEIFATSAGEPTGAALASKVLVADDVLTTSYALEEFVLDSPLDIDADTVYAITWKVPDTNEANRVVAQFANSGNPYADGTFLYSTDSGSNWTIEADYDFRFDIYGKPRANRVYKTDASFDDERTTKFLGFVNENTSVGDNVDVNTVGEQIGFSGLTVGSIYYLSDTAGEISDVAGTRSVKVGIAVSATELSLYSRSTANKKTKVSSGLRNSNDAEQNTTETSYVKLKEILLNEDIDVLKIGFTSKMGSGGTSGKARIYKNGVALGTEQSIVDSGDQTHTQDFTEFSSGDLIQIYAHVNTGGWTIYVWNFRFYYTDYITAFGGNNLAADIELETVVKSTTNQDP